MEAFNLTEELIVSVLASKRRNAFWAISALLALVLGAVSVSKMEGAEIEQAQTIIWGTFAIQNVESGKNLRPYAAGKENGNSIILYSHWRWKCMTWQFVRTSGDSYRLINRYTGKTFQPQSEPKPGVRLWQQPSGDQEGQEWDFLRQGDGSYRIRMKGSNLYLTSSASETNSPVMLTLYEDTPAQRWKLREQDPWL